VNGRSERLSRLLTIRRLTEELDRTALAAALASVAEVETAVGRQESSITEAKAAARAALSGGDRIAGLMAEVQSEIAERNRVQLGVLLRVRAAEVGPAMEKFLESRREHEQVNQLIENARVARRLEEDHKSQAAADDWFLSRRTREME